MRDRASVGINLRRIGLGVESVTQTFIGEMLKFFGLWMNAAGVDARLVLQILLPKSMRTNQVLCTHPSLLGQHDQSSSARVTSPRRSSHASTLGATDVAEQAFSAIQPGVPPACSCCSPMRYNTATTSSARIRKLNSWSADNLTRMP